VLDARAICTQIPDMTRVVVDARTMAPWRAIAGFLAVECVALQVLLREHSARLATLALTVDVALLALGVYVFVVRPHGLGALSLGGVASVRALLFGLLTQRAAAWLLRLPDPLGVSPWLVALAVELALLGLLVLSPKHGLTAILPERLAVLVASEWRVLGAALAWLTRRPLRTRSGFGALATSTYPAFALALVVMCGVEAPAVHVLVHALAGARAGVLHLAVLVLHVYSLMWLAGDLRLLREARHQLQREGVDLSLGARAQVFVPYRAIRSAELGVAREGALRITPKDTPNVQLELAEPLRVSRLLGLGRTARRLALYVDEPEAFVAALRGRLPGASPEA
jgi:hypothetical protein